MTQARFSKLLVDEAATVAMGGQLANAVKDKIKSGIIVYLHGDLGAGKTTLTRGFIQGLGHQGAVKSPTYTLVEPYELADWRAYHFDLYRLGDPEELEFMGIRDYFDQQSSSFIEWPEKGHGLLPEADIDIYLSYQDEQRIIEIDGNTSKGRQLLALLS